MKKIKFAAQVLFLVAAFPVLFVSGISQTSTGTADVNEFSIHESIPATKIIQDDDCICKVECHGYELKTIHTDLKN